MKKWIIGISTLTLLSLTIPAAWAGDGLQRHSPATHPTLVPTIGEVQDQPTAHRWDVRSSVQVSRTDLRAAYEASRTAYTQKLQKFTKCTPTEAQKSVAAAHPDMKASTVQLRNIKTNLVYVAFAEDDEDRYLVIVDAGNGKVLLDKPLPTHHERVFGEHSIH